MKKMSTEEFISKAKKIHGDKYDYSKVEYINNRTKVCIVCHKHGEFWQTPNTHLDGSGCKQCFSEKRGESKRLTYEIFLERAKEIYGNKYDYSKVKYINVMTPVCIICPKHGEFWQTPNSHINNKHQCPKCSHRSFRKTTQEFIKEAKEVHGDKYDYSKTVYLNQYEPVCIICPEHGEFWQTPKVHLKSIYGCPLCSNKENGFKKRLDFENFIKKAKEIHGDKYDYSKVEYNNTDTKICIICPEHGEFWQAPHNHISQKQGCPYCNESHLSKEVKNILLENNIVFEQEKTFEWLKYKKPLHLDFYLPDKNIVIECHGEQHFNRFRWENNDKMLKIRQKRDNIKYELCNKHNIKVLYYANKKYTENMITNISDLINTINKT